MCIGVCYKYKKTKKNKYNVTITITYYNIICQKNVW